jgi:drug/metabolite transporter (DMT)-like permease
MQVVQKSSLKGGSHYEFNTYAVIMSAEFIKFFMSLGMYVQSKPEKFIPDVPIQFILTYTALAFMYCLNNQLTFVLLAWMGPGQMTLAKSFSPVFAAYLLWTMYGEKLSSNRVLCLLVAAFGLMMLFYDPVKGFEVSPSKLFFLYMAMALAGSCAVINSKALQGEGKPPLHFQNMMLYAQGWFFNLVLMLGILYDEGKSVGDAFNGFGGYAFVIIFLHSLNGIAITLVLKYGGAVEKSLAAGIIAVLLLFSDFILFGAEPTVLKVIGGIIAAVAIYAYKKINNNTSDGPAAWGMRSSVGTVVAGLSIAWGIYAIVAEAVTEDAPAGDDQRHLSFAAMIQSHSDEHSALHWHSYDHLQFSPDIDSVFAEEVGAGGYSFLQQEGGQGGCPCCSECCLAQNPVAPGPKVIQAKAGSGCNCCATSICTDAIDCPLGNTQAAFEQHDTPADQTPPGTEVVSMPEPNAAEDSHAAQGLSSSSTMLLQKSDRSSSYALQPGVADAF